MYLVHKIKRVDFFQEFIVKQHFAVNLSTSFNRLIKLMNQRNVIFLYAATFNIAQSQFFAECIYVHIESTIWRNNFNTRQIPLSVIIS